MYKLLIEWLRRKLELPVYESRCDACEAYKSEISNLRSENKRLLDALLTTSVINNEEDEDVDLSKKIRLPRNLPWHIRRQELEREDRVKAKLMKDAPKPLEAVDSGKSSIEELESVILEKEVG